MKADIVVVGGGASGCVLAQALATAGKTVIVVESGRGDPVGDWREGTWIDPLYDEVEVSADLPYNIRYSRVKAFGGGTEAWEGYSYRFLDEEFKTYTRCGYGMDWPLELDDLEPYYREAERLLGVAGDHSEFGRPQVDRAPLPPFPYEDYERRIIHGGREIGLSFIHVPQARNSLGYNHRRACSNSGVCNFCPTGARWSPSAALIPHMRRNPKIKTLLETICAEVLHGERRKASGIIAYSKRTGQKFQIRSDVIILAAGTIDTTRILLLSQKLFELNKGKNPMDVVGRGFMDHPVIRVRIGSNWRRSSRKRQTNILASCHDYRSFDSQTRSPGFLINLNSRIAAPDLLLAAHMEMMPHPDNRISLSNQQDAAGLAVPKLNINSKRGLQAATASRAVEVMGRLASVTGEGEFELLPLQLWACHLMGGTPLGNNPEISVVDKNLRLHSHDNVFIASLSVMPSSSSVNPTLTLVALSLRLRDYVLS